jgi:hypothetical protein
VRWLKILVYKDKNGYTTKELKTPTKRTRRTHKPRPEKTVPLFSVQPSGEAKTTGTPTTKRKERPIKASSVN